MVAHGAAEYIIRTLPHRDAMTPGPREHERLFRLKTTETQAWDELMRIPNATCQAEAADHWRILPSGRPRAQSVCWLFCWGVPERAGPKTADAARDVFDAILHPAHAWAERRLSHEWAKQARDTEGDIEALFYKVLDRS